MTTLKDKGQRATRQANKIGRRILLLANGVDRRKQVYIGSIRVTLSRPTVRVATIASPISLL